MARPRRGQYDGVLELTGLVKRYGDAHRPPARIAAGGVPWWEIRLGLAVTIVAVVVVVRTAARIYAGARLAQGGRIGLRRAWPAAGELAAR